MSDNLLHIGRHELEHKPMSEKEHMAFLKSVLEGIHNGTIKVEGLRSALHKSPYVKTLEEFVCTQDSKTNPI